MTVINLMLAVGFAIGLVLTTSDLLLPSPLPSLLASISYMTLWVLQPVLVYKWSKQWNKKLKNLTPINT